MDLVIILLGNILLATIQIFFIVMVFLLLIFIILCVYRAITEDTSSKRQGK